MAVPTDIGNQALDAAGIEFTMGDIQEGTRPAQVMLRAYTECLKQLHRAAPWDFARREADLLLLADATGQTANVGTVVPSGFIYEYRYPTDCARLRYIPWNPLQNPGAPSSNIQPSNPSSPTMTNITAPLIGQRIVPARFLLTNDPNYPSLSGQAYDQTQGMSPVGSTVILTNVQYAKCVYTFFAAYPSLWDSQFRAAFVSYLACEISVALAKDKKFGLIMHDRLTAVVKEKLMQARISDGQEGWHSSDIAVDWMRARNAGGGGFWAQGNSGGVGEYGCWGGGWAGSLAFGNGSAY